MHKREILRGDATPAWRRVEPLALPPAL